VEQKQKHQQSLPFDSSCRTVSAQMDANNSAEIPQRLWPRTRCDNSPRDCTAFNNELCGWNGVPSLIAANESIVPVSALSCNRSQLFSARSRWQKVIEHACCLHLKVTSKHSIKQQDPIARSSAIA
jgi:hypothetical protein